MLPLIKPLLPDLRDALYEGIAYADDLQPDSSDRDPWYWSNSARWRARRTLKSRISPDDWELIPDVPNGGIHLRNGLLIVRVLRSVGGTTPAPGFSRSRRVAWVQGRLAFRLEEEETDDDVPMADLVLDWTYDEEGLAAHLGMPVGVWEHGEAPVLAWRVPLPIEETDLVDLVFASEDHAPDVPVRLRLDKAETDGE